MTAPSSSAQPMMGPRKDADNPEATRPVKRSATPLEHRPTRAMLPGVRNTTARKPLVWAVGGVDPSGGAGLWLDLRVLAAHGVEGRGLVTTVTAQGDGLWLTAQALAADLLAAQAEALLRTEGPPAAVKLGALASSACAGVVADLVADLGVPVVLDPVLRSSSGGPLADAELLDALRERLLPLTTVLTPNVPEAEALARIPVGSPEQARTAAERLRATGPEAVLLKGGHLTADPVVDWLLTASGPERLTHPRLAHDVRGTGCALASAVAARLALGHPVPRACRQATEWLAAALVGASPGPSGAWRLGVLPQSSR